ncbi:TraR/DksA family transcriptional regulator [Eilatimonas milleporae]|uniref:TraR/DksA family transcriptional regulator n=1 Tax=Eilatimonas milleporae TaxID=911205 RepID=A0A3M0CXL3_9PROT|nr:TraR/DksA C4-type zinc finger protein [Eilatimonas milleporae]RMB08653.1 TraR/DksA family transcriptional regulator [Eilatimonas milleporae]
MDDTSDSEKQHPGLRERDDLPYWRNRLEQAQAALLETDAVSRDGRDAVELDQSRIGRLSRMDAMQGQAMNQAVAARRRAALVRIDKAFARLDGGDFGYCEACGEDIALKRLDLDPSVSLCTLCAR